MSATKPKATRKKYGVMPQDPRLIARVRGDAGVYPVYALNWGSDSVLIYRASEFEWLSIKRVALEPAPKDTE